MYILDKPSIVYGFTDAHLLAYRDGRHTS